MSDIAEQLERIVTCDSMSSTFGRDSTSYSKAMLTSTEGHDNLGTLQLFTHGQKDHGESVLEDPQQGNSSFSQ